MHEPMTVNGLPDGVGTPGRLVHQARRIVVKVGSSVSSDDTDRWGPIAADMAWLHERGKQVVIVASGAVALGRAARPSMGHRSPKERRACASVGQMRLTTRLQQRFEAAGLCAAQVLVRHDDRVDPAAAPRLAALLDDLCADGVVPILNEDDCHRIEGACFADNDQLAAWVAQVWAAQLLVFLTDVDGVFDRDPANPDAQLLRHLGVAALHTVHPGGAEAGGKGTGGMRSKIEAARLAAGQGCSSVIASGARPAPISGSALTGRCTVIEAAPHLADRADHDPRPTRRAGEPVRDVMEA
ncbi:hypothetical protein [Ideonella sp.]|uniref:amino acid kinase family protein n=1 Tax=Ideonella sp. TaxID=1929293 RepID=UPI0035AEBBF1